MADEYLLSHPHTRFRKAQRWFVKGKRPDGSTGKWDPKDRERVVAYLRWRDDRRCGLCALKLAGPDAQIEHVVPKKFGLFDFKSNRRGRRAVAGREWRSRLHHPDNLQVAHEYCNRAKGNTPDPSKWRHPEMRPLPVAERKGRPSWLWVPLDTKTSTDTAGATEPPRDRSEPTPADQERVHVSRSTIPPSSKQSDEELLRILKAWRTSKAREDGNPAYTILTDRTLKELASSRPRQIEDVKKVYGIGPAKLERYGQDLLDLISGVRLP